MARVALPGPAISAVERGFESQLRYCLMAWKQLLY